MAALERRDTSQVTLRPMRWLDVDQVAAIDADVFGATAWSVAAFWSELAGVPATRKYVVAVDGAEVVAYGGAAFGLDDADVQTIAVARSHQRTGLGRRIMDDLIAASAERGCGQLFLEVRADNAPAIELYKHLGFEQISVRTSYYAPGVDAVIMRLRLGQGGELA